MKALSIQQPWTWAILTQGKNIENRTWTTNYRGPLVIHAGIKWDVDGPDIPHALERTKKDLEALRTGGIVGIVDLVDCLTPVQAVRDPRTRKNEWYAGTRSLDGVCAWILENPRILPFIPLKGQLGIFYLKADVVEEIEEALEGM